MFLLTDLERLKVEEHFGPAFHERITNLLDRYTKRWNLEVSEMVDYYSINSLFRVHAPLYGDCVLKICQPGPEVKTEIACLKIYEGHGFCRLFDFDLEDSVLLVERIVPGTILRDLATVEERVFHFAKVYRSLHHPDGNFDSFPTYDRWVSRISRYMEGLADEPEMRRYMLEAEEQYLHLRARYPKNLLLHGDLHHDNLLLATDGSYRVIDPKGVVGDPVFDLPRFVLNEYQDEFDLEANVRHLDRTIQLIAVQIGVDLATLATAHFIEAAMGNAWMVEDNEEPNRLQVEAARLLAEQYN